VPSTSQPTVVARTASVVDTRALAAEVAALIGPGDVVVLGGDLGAGKTAFTQGLGVALGVTEQIVSPTFTIERVYEGRVTLHHLDVYRLDNLHEALDLGLDEALDDGEVAVVEWGEAISGVLGRDYLLVRLAMGAGDDDRTVSFLAHGPRWTARVDALRSAVAPWAVETLVDVELDGHGSATPDELRVDDGDEDVD
jgi:tRNA threonylcarbamoyladenosine biosynthesis protein TsaE